MATFTPSRYQQDVFTWIEAGKGHAVIKAVPGSGKSTTLLQASKLPSIQRVSKAVFLAFNKSIQEELQAKLTEMGSRMKAMTINGFGFSAVRKTFGNEKFNVQDRRDSTKGVQSNKYYSICKNYLIANNAYDYDRLKKFQKLVSLARMTLTPLNEDALWSLSEHYDLEFERHGEKKQEWEVVYKGVADVVAAGLLQVFVGQDTSKVSSHKMEAIQPVLTAFLKQREVSQEMVQQAIDATATEKGLIDFDDQVFLPLLWNLSPEKMDFIFIDESQDLNAARLELILRAVNGTGRLLFVGDENQCQPAGTMVRLPDGSEKPIEQIKTGDLVVSYDRPSQMFVKKTKVNNVASRFYNGKLYTVKAGEKQSQSTDSHKWLVRWTNSTSDKWITYIMRQGKRYRIGQTRMFLKLNAKKSNNFDFGLASRARQEKADAAWVLKIHDSLADALVYEQVLSATYGLPEVCFNESYGIRCFTQEIIDSIYNALPFLEGRAIECLEDHGRKLEYPLYTGSNGLNSDGNTGRQRQGRSTLFETQACNLMSGYMAIPVAPDYIHSNKDRSIRQLVANSWQPIEVTAEPFSGTVYSLDVDKYHSYVADGLVTLNSIYGFSGADTDSMNNIIKRTNATVLPLSICYRCPSSHIKLCADIVPGLEAAPNAPEGLISYIHPYQLEDVVQEGDLILCRIKAPLVSTCLSLIRSGKRAKVRGTDIGAKLVKDVQKLNKSKKGKITVATLRDFMSDYRREQAVFIGIGPESELELAELDDKVDTINALCDAYCSEYTDEATWNMESLYAYMENFFSDERGEIIILSTVHKAKGLEENRVFILQPEKMPHPKAKPGWQYTQEMNIKYVAYSRAKFDTKAGKQGELYFVTESAPLHEEVAPELPPLTLEDLFAFEEVQDTIETAPVLLESVVEAPEVLEPVNETSIEQEPSESLVNALRAMKSAAGKKGGKGVKRGKVQRNVKFSEENNAFLKSLVAQGKDTSEFIDRLVSLYREVQTPARDMLEERIPV